jgi:hypothetical protein
MMLRVFKGCTSMVTTILYKNIMVQCTGSRLKKLLACTCVVSDISALEPQSVCWLQWSNLNHQQNFISILHRTKQPHCDLIMCIELATNKQASQKPAGLAGTSSTCHEHFHSQAVPAVPAATKQHSQCCNHDELHYAEHSNSTLVNTCCS